MHKIFLIISAVFLLANFSFTPAAQSEVTTQSAQNNDSVESTDSTLNKTEILDKCRAKKKASEFNQCVSKLVKSSNNSVLINALKDCTQKNAKSKKGCIEGFLIQSCPRGYSVCGHGCCPS